MWCYMVIWIGCFSVYFYGGMVLIYLRIIMIIYFIVEEDR